MTPNENKPKKPGLQSEGRNHFRTLKSKLADTMVVTTCVQSAAARPVQALGDGENTAHAVWHSAGHDPAQPNGKGFRGQKIRRSGPAQLYHRGDCSERNFNKSRELLCQMLD